MSNMFDLIKRLATKGEAYWLFKNKQHTQFMEALGEEPARIKTFFDQVKLSGIPDGNLPADSLADWETFLGLTPNDSLTAEQKNERIKGKYSSQGGQGPDYIQDTLQAAGFPVYVTENNPVVDPHLYTGLLIPGPPTYRTKKIYDATFGSFSFGGKSFGAELGTVIEEVVVTIPYDPSRYIFVWFLTGPLGLNDFVDIPIARREDFIKQVLQIKPAHTWVIAQVNFI